MVSRRINIWDAVSGLPPVALGLGGATILAMEGRVLETAMVLGLIGFHWYTRVILIRRRMTAEQTADFSAANALTTAGCYALPFFIAATMH